MAGLVRATQSYWAGNAFVQEGTVLAEGDPKIVPGYVEDFQVPEAAASEAPVAAAAVEPAAEAEPAPRGRAKK